MPKNTPYYILVKSKLEITRTDTDTDTKTHIMFTIVKLEIKRRKIFWKSLNIWKLNNTILNLWTATKAILWGIFIVPCEWVKVTQFCLTFCNPMDCISSVQSLSHVQFFATPWITAHQASLSTTNSRSSLRLMSIESVMPSSHLILCRPLLLLPPIPPSIRVFSVTQV